MNGPEESLTIASPASSSSGQISVAAAKAEPQKLFEFLLPECKLANRAGTVRMTQSSSKTKSVVCL